MSERLTLEQEIRLIDFTSQAQRMSREQAIVVAIELFESILVRETICRQIFKNESRLPPLKEFYGND